MDKSLHPAVALDTVTCFGHGLNRPECALAHRSGLIFVPDWTDTGGIAVLSPDGRVTRVLARDPPEPLRPNGIALVEGGAFLLAHLGATTGGLYRMEADGTVASVLTEVGGQPLPPCNFVHCDHEGRTWLTVSTRRVPRADGYRSDVADGFIVLIDEAGARIVADNLGYTNEAVAHPDGRSLWVNETFGRRLTAFDVEADGTLTRRRTITTFGPGTFPDGLAFDSEGHAWVTSIVSNRVIRIAPDGSQSLVLEDCDPEHIAWVEAAFQDGTMGRPHLDGIKSRRLRNISNLAFGGPDLRTAYLGCLLCDQIASFRTPVAGVPLAHWTADLGVLERLLDD